MLKVMVGCSYKRNDDFWVSGITTHEPAIIERERERFCYTLRMYLGIFVMLSVESKDSDSLTFLISYLLFSPLEFFCTLFIFIIIII